MGTATLDLIWLNVFIKNFDSSGDWASFSGLSIPKWCFLQSWKRGPSIKFMHFENIVNIDIDVVNKNAIATHCKQPKTTQYSNSYIDLYDF